MTLEQLKEKVHDFISKAKTKEAMEAIVTWAHENNRKQLKDDINLMKGELTALDRQDTLGLLSFQEIAREKAKLNNRLLSLMNGIDINMTDNNKNSFDFDEIDEKIILTLFSFPFDPDVSTLIAKLENEGVSNNEFHKRIPLLRQKKIAEIKRDSSRTDNTVIQMHQFDNAIDYW